MTALAHPLVPQPDAQASAAPLDLPSLLGPSAWRRLPDAVRRRFAPGHAAAGYAGCMDLQCSRIGRLFAALSRMVGSPLTSVCRTGVEAMVRVHDDGRGGMVWERRFGPDGPDAATVRSTKELGPDGGLFERTDGGLGMVLAVFEHDGSLVFESRRYELVAGCRRIRIPSLLTPGTCRVTHTDLGEGRFRFTMEMTHPLWGTTFHQSGVFTDPSPAAPQEPA